LPKVEIFAVVDSGEQASTKDSPDTLEKPPRAPQVHERSVGISASTSRVITVRQSLSYAITVTLRDRLTRTVEAFKKNLRADTVFCRDAFRASFADGWRRSVISAVRRLNRFWEVVLGGGILATLLLLYGKYLYPVIGNAGTAIVGLSLIVFGLLTTIRVTRKLHEKTLLQGAPEDERSVTTDPNNVLSYHRNLIETWREMVVLAERKYMGGKEPAGIAFSEIFQRQPAFIKLVPLLSKHAIDALDADVREEFNRTERKRPVALRALLAKEISRIESELQLFPRLAAPTRRVDHKLVFEINQPKTTVRVEQTESALCVWLGIELRFENKDTFPIAFKRFDISMYRYGIKDQRPGFDIGVQFALLRIMQDQKSIEVKDFEGMMIQERRLTPSYYLYFMMAIEDDQIEKATDLDILDTIYLTMHSTGDQESLVAHIHPHWNLAREGKDGTHLMSITGVPVIEMDYRRLR
jgi:hypothetical protein